MVPRLLALATALILAGPAVAQTADHAARPLPQAGSPGVALGIGQPSENDHPVLFQSQARTDPRWSVRPVERPAYMVRYPVDVIEGAPATRPAVRPNFVPVTRWGRTDRARLWARATMAAVGQHGLDEIVPQDIEAWCPAYARNSPTLRRAFWVGMMSALTKYESTHDPQAVGGGGRWYGLLQILPATARGYGCRATTGAGLKDPILNLACAARIMGHTVARDEAVAVRDGRWRGVAADWGPMTQRAKVAEMSAWTRSQDYCVIPEDPRPRLRPVDLASLATAETRGPPLRGRLSR